MSDYAVENVSVAKDTFLAG